MLFDELVVHNLGLIDTASVDLHPGLTVITGETGAGKTLMLGGLRLLRGDQASKGVIGPHGTTVDVSARIVGGDSETVLRRTVDSNRSRAYVDGAATTAKALADATKGVVSIVGQHDQHEITSSNGIRALVDGNLSAAGTRLRSTYREAWSAYTDLLRELDDIGGDLRALEREADVLEFQIAEIDGAGFEVGDEAVLRSNAARLRSAEALRSDVAESLDALGDEGVSQGLERAMRALQNAASVDESLDPVVSSIAQTVDEVNAAAIELARYATDLDAGAQDLDAVESRLELLGSLQRKYGATLEDVASFHKRSAERLTQLRVLLDSASDIDQRLASALETVQGVGTRLAKERRRSAENISASAITHLKDLGFSDPVVEVQVADEEATSRGCDSLRLLFASDASLTPAPASAIASGGELSRLVLALTLSAGVTDTALVAFDEIDAGIGGATALAMGEKLAMLARDRQVVCVTHLPQVAAYGAHHLVVTRNGTAASVASVDGDDRQREIARMLAGLGESDTALQHAEELLALGRSDS